MDARDPRTKLTPLGTLCASLRDAVPTLPSPSTRERGTGAGAKDRGGHGEQGARGGGPGGGGQGALKGLTDRDLDAVLRIVRLLLRFGADVNPSYPPPHANSNANSTAVSDGFHPLDSDGTPTRASLNSGSSRAAVAWEPPLHSVAAAANLSKLYGDEVGKRIHRVMRTLLVAGADPEVANGQGKTALMCVSTYVAEELTAAALGPDLDTGSPCLCCVACPPLTVPPCLPQV